MAKVRVCKRCGSEVDKSEVEGYTFSCKECDEDLFAIETHEKVKLNRRNIKYAIAKKTGEIEEYMQELGGVDCFSDDIGNAIIFHNWRNIPFNALEPSDYIVKVDDEEGLSVIGKLTEAEMNES